ncbi:uncharacterized protein LOC126881120 [Diabrotica virgifera virgifera]|uniref:Uncharacterized protein LOC114341206 n=1 Tax=Diabrotica virgifera virgifera TaxID=50390 RepID=A0A6P7GE40_DIAVI|nr:uncharacterized protein LOC126881120 [Diabrotica virgifera virgifera]
MSINLFLYLLMFSSAICLTKGTSVERIPKKSAQSDNTDTNKETHKEPAVQISAKPAKPVTHSDSSSSVKKDSVKQTPHNQTTSVTKAEKVLDGNNDVPESNSAQAESGAVIRGVLVFGGLGLIFLIYVGVRTYRRRKMPIIRKYGVRARRSDVEMRPLPLDDDEEDETVFDLSHLNKP